MNLDRKKTFPGSIEHRKKAERMGITDLFTSYNVEIQHYNPGHKH